MALCEVRLDEDLSFCGLATILRISPALDQRGLPLRRTLCSGRCGKSFLLVFLVPVERLAFCLREIGEFRILLL